MTSKLQKASTFPVDLLSLLWVAVNRWPGMICKSRYCLDVAGFNRCDHNVSNTFQRLMSSIDFPRIYIQNIPFYKRKTETVRRTSKRPKLWWFLKGITIYVRLLLLFLLQDESVICSSHRHAVLRDPCVKCLKRCVLERFVLELPVRALREYLCVICTAVLH